ncbi:MAG: hypothetical protein M1298_05445, partial [Chloroflexi bacterium]|nr:hypothetical protein [Chloroflexota bacterium]
MLQQLADVEDQLTTVERQLPALAAAEEEVAIAEEELRRFYTIQRSLDQALAIFQRLQLERPSVSAILNRALNPWLTRLTGGRYQEVYIDRDTLDLRLRDARGILHPLE